MTVSLKRIKVDENSNAFGEGTSVLDEGSLLVASNNDRILQDSITSGIGILIVDITQTNSSGIFTVNLPDSVGNNLDAYLEIDNNNDVTFKS